MIGYASKERAPNGDANRLPILSPVIQFPHMSVLVRQWRWLLQLDYATSSEAPPAPRRHPLGTPLSLLQE